MTLTSKANSVTFPKNVLGIKSSGHEMKNHVELDFTKYLQQTVSLLFGIGTWVCFICLQVYLFIDTQGTGHGFSWWQLGLCCGLNQIKGPAKWRDFMRMYKYVWGTVYGSEILDHLIGSSFIPLFTVCFLHPRWCRISSIYSSIWTFGGSSQCLLCRWTLSLYHQYSFWPLTMSLNMF